MDRYHKPVVKTPSLKVVGQHPFQGHQPGESFDQPADPAQRRQVAAAIESGAVAYDGGVIDAAMTCPACTERLKRPPKLSDPADLAEHYADRHPGLVVPDWTEETEA